MQYIEKEKRQHIRFPVAAALRYQIRGVQEFGSALTKNISRGGVSFIVDRFIKPDTHILLNFNILSRNISSVATVRWAENLPHSDRYQLGLEFEGLAAEDKTYISDYVNMRTS